MYMDQARLSVAFQRTKVVLPFKICEQASLVRPDSTDEQAMSVFLEWTDLSHLWSFNGRVGLVHGTSMDGCYSGEKKIKIKQNLIIQNWLIYFKCFS